MGCCRANNLDLALGPNRLDHAVTTYLPSISLKVPYSAAQDQVHAEVWQRQSIYPPSMHTPTGGSHFPLAIHYT